MFIPLKQHLEVEPIAHDSIIQTPVGNYEQKGIVVSVADDCDFFSDEEIGCVVFFDSWLASKYIDSAGKDRWLVPEEAIRAYENKE